MSHIINIIDKPICSTNCFFEIIIIFDIVLSPVTLFHTGMTKYTIK